MSWCEGDEADVMGKEDFKGGSSLGLYTKEQRTVDASHRISFLFLENAKMKQHHSTTAHPAK